MTRFSPLFLLLLAALTLSACDLWDHSGDGNDDPTEDRVLLPLNDGNVWVMEFTRRNAEGELTETLIDTLRVVGDTLIAGERWTEIRCARFRSGCIPGGFYSNREDGVWKWGDPSEDGSPYLLYKYPARVGTSYELPGQTNLTVTVLGRADPVETPAGTLRAYHYAMDTDEAYGHPVSEGAGRFERYLVPGQGFASIGCWYLRLNDEGELVLHQTFGWQLIAFETP